MMDMHAGFEENDSALARIARPDEMPFRGKRPSTVNAGAALRIEAAANTIAVIIVVTFAVIFAYLYWKHRSSDVAPPPTLPIPASPAAHIHGT